MKVTNKIVILFLLLANIANIYAEDPPSPPSTARPAAALAPPPPPQEPIDGSLVLLISAGILLGIYIIYKHKLNTKASA